MMMWKYMLAAILLAVTTQTSLCQLEDSATYLLYADHVIISRLTLDGVHDLLPLLSLRRASVLDYDYARGFLYWFDHDKNGIFRSYLNGSDQIQLVNTSLYGLVEDIAVDWVSNKLYWTETHYRRIDVLDLDTLRIAPVVTIDPHSGVRGIAVDPSTRYMYWTDWGDPAKIERASMDGTNRQTIHSSGVGQPNGIAIDYQTQRIYWTDSNTSSIDYSNVDGTGRQRLQSDLPYPYGITVEGSQVFFTDSRNAGVYSAHKLNSGDVMRFNTLVIRPIGIEAVSPNRQNNASNPCADSACDHICLLSTDPRGYSCVCEDGYLLDSDQQGCTCTCNAAGYDECCTGGFCAGHPPTCFCDIQCMDRGDCCDDFSDICELPPSSCSAAGYDTCCHFNPFDSTLCIGVSTIGECYCDESCRLYGECCDDIDTTCPGGSCANISCCDDDSTCLGSPPTCSCHVDCIETGSCCSDFISFYQPVPVTSLEVLSLNASSLNMSWSFNSSLEICNDNIIEITVASHSAGIVFNASLNADVRYLVVTEGLAKWIPYTVSVTTRNQLVAANSIEVIVFTKQGLPSIAPTNVTVERTSETEMTVSWTPLTLEEARGFVIFYTVTYHPVMTVQESRKRQLGGGSIQVSADDDQVEINDLQPGVDYSVSVRATTVVGSGETSEEVTSGSGPTQASNNMANVGGIVAGVVVGVIVLIAVALLVILLIIFCVRRQRSKYHFKQKHDQPSAGTLSQSSKSSQDASAIMLGDKPKLAFSSGRPTSTVPLLEDPVCFSMTGDPEPRYAPINNFEKLVTEAPPTNSEGTARAPLADKNEYQVIAKPQTIQVEEGNQSMLG